MQSKKEITTCIFKIWPNEGKTIESWYSIKDCVLANTHNSSNLKFNWYINNHWSFLVSLIRMVEWKKEKPYMYIEIREKTWLQKDGQWGPRKQTDAALNVKMIRATWLVRIASISKSLKVPVVMYKLWLHFYHFSSWKTKFNNASRDSEVCCLGCACFSLFNYGRKCFLAPTSHP